MSMYDIILGLLVIGFVSLMFGALAYNFYDLTDLARNFTNDTVANEGFSQAETSMYVSLFFIVLFILVWMFRSNTTKYATQ